MSASGCASCEVKMTGASQGAVDRSLRSWSWTLLFIWLRKGMDCNLFTGRCLANGSAAVHAVCVVHTVVRPPQMCLPSCQWQPDCASSVQVMCVPVPQLEMDASLRRCGWGLSLDVRELSGVIQLRQGKAKAT